MNTILMYCITTILGVLIGFMINLIKSYIGKEKAEKKALKCLLRSNIVTQYYVYREIGSIPFYVKESILEEFEAYKELKGNSFVMQLVEEIKKWKVQK